MFYLFYNVCFCFWLFLLLLGTFIVVLVFILNMSMCVYMLAKVFLEMLFLLIFKTTTKKERKRRNAKFIFYFITVLQLLSLLFHLLTTQTKNTPVRMTQPIQLKCAYQRLLGWYYEIENFQNLSFIYFIFLAFLNWLQQIIKFEIFFCHSSFDFFFSIFS